MMRALPMALITSVLIATAACGGSTNVAQGGGAGGGNPLKNGIPIPITYKMNAGKCEGNLDNLFQSPQKIKRTKHLYWVVTNVDCPNFKFTDACVDFYDPPNDMFLDNGNHPCANAGNEMIDGVVSGDPLKAPDDSKHLYHIVYGSVSTGDPEIDIACDGCSGGSNAAASTAAAPAAARPPVPSNGIAIPVTFNLVNGTCIGSLDNNFQYMQKIKRSKTGMDHHLYWQIANNNCTAFDFTKACVDFGTTDKLLTNNTTHLCSNPGNNLIDGVVTKSMSDAPDNSSHLYSIRYDGKAGGDPEIDIACDGCSDK